MALNIKRIISNKGLTSKELAEKLGMTAVNLSYHINGNPTIEILNRIANALECDVSELFDPPAANEINCPVCGAKLTLKKRE